MVILIKFFFCAVVLIRWGLHSDIDKAEFCTVILIRWEFAQ